MPLPESYTVTPIRPDVGLTMSDTVGARVEPSIRLGSAFKQLLTRAFHATNGELMADPEINHPFDDPDTRIDEAAYSEGEFTVVTAETSTALTDEDADVFAIAIAYLIRQVTGRPVDVKPFDKPI